MWTRAYTHPTSADPQRLWQLLADVDGWVHWNDGIQHIALDGTVTVGAVFQMTPCGGHPVISTIVDLDPPRLLTDSTDFEGLTIRVEHSLDPAPGGTTIIRFTATVTGDATGDVAAEVGAAVTADFPDVMANLAAAAET